MRRPAVAPETWCADGVNRVRCPWCAAIGFLGEAPPGCPHFVLADGADGPMWDVGEAVRRFAHIVGAMPKVGVEEAVRSAPDGIRQDIAAAQLRGDAWWRDDERYVRTTTVTVEEASGACDYWDWYHPVPGRGAALLVRVNTAADWISPGAEGL